MRKVLLTLGAAALALSGPAVARGQGGGHGRGHDAAQPDRGGEARGNRGQRGQRADRGGGRLERADRGGGRQLRAAAQVDDGGRGRGRGRDDQVRRERGREGRADIRVDERGRGREGRADARVDDRGRGRGRDDALQRRGREDRANVRFDDRGRGRGERRVERRAIVVTEPARIVRIEPRPRFDFVRGCPPGLARRDNGCLPPGHARRLAASRFWYDDWWGVRPASGSYRYDDGFLYNIRPDGAVAGFLPLLGGALWPGNPWPASYQAYPVPDYYVDYFGYDDPYDYRYADGVIYGVDPSSNAIEEVVALLTGDPWAIGSPMPAGYDIYNVPYAYRGQYHDTPDSWYRYSDGYVYQVDPTTRLIEAVIQLIA